MDRYADGFSLLIRVVEGQDVREDQLGCASASERTTVLGFSRVGRYIQSSQAD